MAVPKKRGTSSKRGRRRSHLALKPIMLSVCSKCKHPSEQHRACSYCGYYKNKKVIKNA